ncbi:MAG: hypothetical protein FWE15_14790 [Actinomycetia bacterium]|nr:hypothetical protein [Actinomycetes bacterium]
MSHQDPPPQPPPPGSKPPGSTGPTPSGPTTGPAPHGGRHPRQESGTRAAWAAGGTVFAGLMLLIAGVMAILEGIVGIHRDAVYMVTRGSYAYKFNVTSWGWIHLVLGVIAVLVGYGVLRGMEWARWAGIFIAGLNMIANFMFLPYQPVWAIVMVAIDVYIIWALATYHPAESRNGGVLL